MKKTAHAFLPQFKLSLLAATLTMGFSHVAHAEPGDVFSGSVGTTYISDNNLFRLPDGQSPAAFAGKDQRSDKLWRTFLSGTFDKKVSLQEFIVKGTYTDNRYSTYSDFNSHNVDYSALWNWRLGRSLSGELSYTQDEYTSTFADFRSNTGPNIGRYKRALASVYFEFFPRWEAFASFNQVKVQNSIDSLRSANLKSDNTELGLRMSLSDATKVRFLVRASDGKYPDRAVGSDDNQYKQKDFETNGAWQITGKSNLTGALAYTKRDYDFIPARNFSGVTGSLAWDYVLSGSTSFKLGAGRELFGIQDLTSTYILTNRYSASVNYLLTQKTSFNALYDKRSRNYAGDTGLVANAATRKDDIKAYQLGVNYAALRALNLGLFYRKEDRSSNIFGLDYNNRTVGAQATFSF